MERQATRILVIGKDPIFAWALEQKATVLGYHLEHVYTLGEARLRLSRFQYAVVLLDGLGRDDTESLSDELKFCSTVFILQDVSSDTGDVLNEMDRKPAPVTLPKESALPRILEFLQPLTH